MIDTSLVDKYNSGTSLSELRRISGISTYMLKKELIALGIHIRSRNEQNKFSPQNQRIYSINDNYFSKQNPNMAYLLGFIAADGCVYEKCNEIKIALASVDRPFLNIISNELQSNFPIRDYVTKDGYTNSELKITSRQIKEDLATYNIVPRKTYNYRFPSLLDKVYYKDFIRGYFDGDGSISTVGQRAIRWQLCSHEQDILEKVVEFFNENKIDPVSIYKVKDKQLYYIQYSTVSTKKIYNILYYENCMCLPRKKEKYDSLMK